MIRLTALPCDEFRVNTSEYNSLPSPTIQARIRWIEEHICNKTEDFTSDPQWFVSEWETLTEEDMPKKYTKDIPLQIITYGIGGKGKRATGVYEIEYLPLTTQKGQPCVYPEDRLVADFLKFNQKVYILKYSLLKQLTWSESHPSNQGWTRSHPGEGV